MSITFNPMLTTGPSDSFALDAEGAVAGTMNDDPALRYQIEGGVISSAESGIIYGGIPILLKLPATATQPANAQGPVVLKATNYATTTAWAIFNQASAMLITPSSNVPTASTGMSVNFLRAGSRARIVLPIDPTLVDTVLGGNDTQTVSWDFTAQQIVAFSSTALPVQLIQIFQNAQIVHVSGSTYTWTTGPAALVQI